MDRCGEKLAIVFASLGIVALVLTILMVPISEVKAAAAGPVKPTCINTCQDAGIPPNCSCPNNGGLNTCSPGCAGASCTNCKPGVAFGSCVCGCTALAGQC